MTETIATVTNYVELVDAFRAAKERLGLSNAFCDEKGGIAVGHTDKALGPTRAKNISPMLFDLFCSFFAVKFVMVDDVDAAQRMESVWEQREERNVRSSSSRVSKSIIERAKPHVFKASGKLGAVARACKLSPELRTKIARKAGKARMRKVTKDERSAMSLKGWQTRKRKLAESADMSGEIEIPLIPTSDNTYTYKPETALPEMKWRDPPDFNEIRQKRCRHERDGGAGGEGDS